MNENLLIRDDTHIEVTGRFIEKTDGGAKQKVPISKDYIPAKGEKVLEYVGFFRYPDYKSHAIIMSKSTVIDKQSGGIYVHPVNLEQNIITDLLYAIQDNDGNRINLTDQDKRNKIDRSDPNIIRELYRQFQMHCHVRFI